MIVGINYTMKELTLFVKRTAIQGTTLKLQAPYTTVHVQ